MNSKVLEIYRLLKENKINVALDLAQKLYNTNTTQPKDFLTVKTLAIAYMLKPDPHLSCYYFKEANSIKSDDFETVTNLASMAYEVQDFYLSEKMALQSIQMDERQHMAYVTLSHLYFTSKDFTLSKNFIEKAIDVLGGDATKLFNTHEGIILSYIDILVALNEKDRAIKLLSSIIKMEPTNIGALLHTLRKVSPDLIGEELIEKSRQEIAILKNSPNNNKNQLRLSHNYFCLGDYYLKRDPEMADNYFILGNEILSTIQRFKPLDHQKKCIENIKTFLSIKDMAVSNKEKGKGLIFITGLPRSGTTLVESIIGSNDLTCTGGELSILPYAITKNFINNPTIEKLESIGDKYLASIQFIRKESIFFVDKLPQNFELIGLISIALPGAKVINLQRNYWDTAISQFQQYFILNVPFTTSFFSMAITAANFKFMIDTYSKFVGNDQLMDIHYEDLVDNPNTYIKKLYEFCAIGAEYSPTKRSDHVSKTASSSQVKSEIHQQSIKKNNFARYKDEFWDTYQNQISFWEKKSL